MRNHSSNERRTPLRSSHRSSRTVAAFGLKCQLSHSWLSNIEWLNFKRIKFSVPPGRTRNNFCPSLPSTSTYEGSTTKDLVRIACHLNTGSPWWWEKVLWWVDKLLPTPKFLVGCDTISFPFFISKISLNLSILSATKPFTDISASVGR